MLKKLFLSTSILLGIILFFWLFFTFFIKEKPNEGILPSIEELPTEPEIDTITSSFQEVIDVPLLSSALSKDQLSLLGYHAETATLYSLNRETFEKTILLDTNLSLPIVSLWSENPEISILKTQPQQGSQYFLINATEKTILPLQGEIAYLVWDSLFEKIIYIRRKNPEEITFYLAKADGSESKEILTIFQKGRIDMASVPQSPLIAYWPQSSNTKLSPLYQINISTGTNKEIFSGKYGANYLYSPDGEKILLSWAPEKNGSKLSLGVINKYGGQYSDLGFPTLTSKCTWNKTSDILYCAVPTEIPQTTIMPDDYLSGKITTTDVFWKITVTTGEKERLVELSDITQSFDATNLLLSSDQRTLYFTDKKSQKLYEIKL